MWPSVLQIIYLLWMQTTKHFILLKSDVCKVMRRRKVTHVALQVGMQEAQTKVQQISPRYHDGDDRICAFQIGKWFRGDCGNCPPSKQNKLFWFYTHQHSGFKCLPSKNPFIASSNPCGISKGNSHHTFSFFARRQCKGRVRVSKRKVFWKRSIFIFNPEINIVDFVPLNRALSRFFREKIAIQFSENGGGTQIPKIHSFW